MSHRESLRTEVIDATEALLDAIDEGDERVQVALDGYVDYIRHPLEQYIACLNRMDALERAEAPDLNLLAALKASLAPPKKRRTRTVKR